MVPSKMMLTIVVALVLPLAGCASSSPPKLAVCDGKPQHRRPANPYGSVLPGAPSPTAQATSGAEISEAKLVVTAPSC